MALLSLASGIICLLSVACLLLLHFEQLGRIEEELSELRKYTFTVGQDLSFLLYVVEENLTDEQRERIGSRMCKCGDGCTCCDSECEDEKIGLTD